MNKYSHVTTTTIKIQNCFIALKVSLCGQPFSLPSAPANLFFLPIIFAVSRISKNGIIQDVAYFTEHSVPEIYQCYCLYQFIIFIVGCSSLCGGASLFVCSPTEGHLDCF